MSCFLSMLSAMICSFEYTGISVSVSLNLRFEVGFLQKHADQCVILWLSKKM